MNKDKIVKDYIMKARNDLNKLEIEYTYQSNLDCHCIRCTKEGQRTHPKFI